LTSSGIYLPLGETLGPEKMRNPAIQFQYKVGEMRNIVEPLTKKTTEFLKTAFTAGFLNKREY